MNPLKYARFDISESVGTVEDAKKLVEQFPTKLELLIPENQREPLMFVLYSYANILEYNAAKASFNEEQGVVCPITKVPAEFDSDYLRDNQCSTTTLEDAASCVALFHEVFSHKLRANPELLPTEEKEFRYKLIFEEMLEFLHSKDSVEQFDALIDIMYLVLGTLAQAGYNQGNLIERGFLEVQRSNMSKLDAQGNPVKREDGKIMKSDLYSAPELNKILNP